MSGHSKWNNIKRKKEKTDGARAKVFTKIGREISVAVRDGGPNPASNSKLAGRIYACGCKPFCSGSWFGYIWYKNGNEKPELL